MNNASIMKTIRDIINPAFDEKITNKMKMQCLYIRARTAEVFSNTGVCIIKSVCVLHHTALIIPEKIQ